MYGRKNEEKKEKDPNPLKSLDQTDNSINIKPKKRNDEDFYDFSYHNMKKSYMDVTEEYNRYKY